MQGQRLDSGFWETRRLRGLLRSMAETLGSAEQAAEEMKFALAHVPAGQKAEPLLERYLAVMRQGDGVDAPALRQAFLHLEQAPPESRTCFALLAAASGRRAAPALEHLRWLEQTTPAGPARLSAARLLAEVLRRAPELPPAQVQDLYAALQALPDTQAALRRLDLLVGLGLTPRQALDELTRLQAGLAPGQSAEEAFQGWLEARNQPRAGQAQAPAASPPAPPDFLEATPWGRRRLEPFLARLEDLAGDPEAARAEMQFLLARVTGSGPPEPLLRRYLDLLEAAEGQDLPAVRQAFALLEGSPPQVEGAFRQLLEATGGRAGAALEHLKALQARPGTDLARAAPLLARLAAAARDYPDDEVRAHFDTLMSFPDPALALERAQRLVDVGLSWGQALADLQGLQARAGPAQDIGGDFELLLSLRRHWKGPGLEPALQLLAQAPPGAPRQERLAAYEKLLDVEEDPGWALQDLQGLLRDHPDPGKLAGRMRHYLGLLASAPPRDRARLRAALAELGPPAEEAPGGLRGLVRRLGWGPPSREEIFRQLYQMEGSPEEALADLRALEASLVPGEDLGEAFAEMKELFMLPQASPPSSVRSAFAHLRQPLPPLFSSRQERRAELLDLAWETGNLELARRLLSFLERSPNQAEYRARREVFHGFLARRRQEPRVAEAWVTLLEGLERLLPPGSSILRTGPRLLELKERGPELLLRVVEAARKALDAGPVAGLSQPELFDHYLEVAGQARSSREVERLEKILHNPSSGRSPYENSRLVACLVQGAASLEGALSQHALLQERLEPGEFAAAVPAYSAILTALRSASREDVALATAGRILDWMAAERAPAGRLQGVPAARVFEEISKSLVLGNEARKAFESAVLALQPESKVEVEEEWIVVGGVRVKRNQRQEGSP
jgi:hypothetical protein